MEFVDLKAFSKAGGTKQIGNCYGLLYIALSFAVVVVAVAWAIITGAHGSIRFSVDLRGAIGTDVGAVNKAEEVIDDIGLECAYGEGIGGWDLFGFEGNTLVGTKDGFVRTRLEVIGLDLSVTTGFIVETTFIATRVSTERHKVGLVETSVRFG